MIETSVPRTRTTGTREERGLRLFRERGEEIRHVKGSVWAVPSCGGEGVYLADLESGVCTCPDTPPADEDCKHVVAATIANAKSASCDGCGLRFLHRKIVELTEGNHDNLTYFDGDLLCLECAEGGGVAL